MFLYIFLINNLNIIRHGLSHEIIINPSLFIWINVIVIFGRNYLV